MFKKKKKEKVLKAHIQKNNPEFVQERISQLEKIADRIERMRLGDYLDSMNRPGHVIWLSLLSGIAKGVGLTIGATLVIAIIFKLLSMLIAMNIPYLTEMLQDVVQIVKTTPGLEKIHGISDLGTTPISVEFEETINHEVK